ncbi:MAG: putative bifunctional diguanylate cyclase/phosphodiesterase, partial [Betaproteobacteria bacterium]
MPTARARTTQVVYLVLVATGAVLAVLALRSVPAFLTVAPEDFWVLAAFALIADIRPFPLPAMSRRASVFVVSISFCFAILLLWGPAAAIVVQVPAALVVAVRLRLGSYRFGLLATRLVCSLAAAGLATELFTRPILSPNGDLDQVDILSVIVPAAAFLVVSVTIGAIGGWLLQVSPKEIAAQLRFDILGRGALLLVAPVLVTAPRGWSVVLLAIPLLGWIQLARMLGDQDRRLNHDPVTGLLSGRGLAVAAAGEPRDTSKESDWLGLLLIQLRGIGYVSGSLGRSASERVLAATATRLRALTERGDHVGRLSDDQFVVLRPGLAELDAGPVAKGIVAALSTPVETDSLPFRLDPVAGVAVAPQHGPDLSALIARAEAALFEARAQGQPVVVFTGEAEAAVQRRIALLSDLRAALEHDPSQLCVVYQPQVVIDSGLVSGVEALLRWTHPVRGLVPTEELIRIAEPSAVMQLLTAHVIDCVVTQLTQWNRDGLTMRVAVNVSMHDLFGTGFDDELRQVLDRHRVPPEQLVVEVTERAMVEDVPRLTEAVRRVARVGVGLSLDDFGTGFASLRQLRQLPLSEMKIDSSYVRRMTDSGQDRAIVRAIHDVARALGLRLVAEGVEDVATVRLLAELDGIIGQGWYFARPMPPEQLTRWVR